MKTDAFIPLFMCICTQHSVTAVKGVSARKAFFDDKNLNFTEGYIILMGAVRHFVRSCRPRF
jgi:hypothetical protein